MGNAQKFLSDQEKKQVKAAIEAAEKMTSGEIMVHIDDRCSEEVLDRAAYWFETLEMHKTELRNGVLIYLAFEDRKFAILGDVGINQKVPVGFWDEVSDTMISHFKQGDFAKGLEVGIKLAGSQLGSHFPYQSTDKNELSDDLSFGEE